MVSENPAPPLPRFGRVGDLVRRAWISPTLMTWASLLIRMGGLAVLLPLVLTRLPAPEVLVWQLLSTITMLISWTDFGFSPTFARIIAFTRGGGGLHDLRAAMPGKVALPASEQAGQLRMGAVLATQRTVYRRLIGVAMLLAVLAGTAALAKPVEGLAHARDGWIAWVITIASSQLVLLNGANVSVLTGFDRIATTRRLEAMIGALQIGSASIVTLAGGGLVAIVACYSFWQLALYILNRRNVMRLGVEARPDEGFDREIFATIWPAAWRSGVGILMSTGIIQASGLVYAQVATAGDAAAYLLALRLMTTVSQISQAPFYSKLPTMARLRGERRILEIVPVAVRGMALAHWTFVAGALGITVAAPILLKLIGSSVQFPGFAMSAMLAVAFFAERYGGMHVQIYSLTNHIVWHVINGVTGALMVVLFFVLHPLLGPLAMPAAMLGAYLGFCTWYASGLSTKSLGVSRWTIDRPTALLPGLVLLAGLGLQGFLVHMGLG